MELGKFWTISCCKPNLDDPGGKRRLASHVMEAGKLDQEPYHKQYQGGGGEHGTGKEPMTMLDRS
jgi:hypothetical protein